MNKRVAMMMIVALVALLVAGGLTAAQSPSSPGTAPQAGQPLSSIGTEDQPLPGKDAAGDYAVQAGTAAGGAYRLATGWQDWSVRGAAVGGSYRIEVVGAVRGTGTPCCCSYLPCALKGYR